MPRKAKFIHSSAQKSLTRVRHDAPVERLVAPGEATAMIFAGYRGSGRLAVLCGRQLDNAGRLTRNAFLATLHPRAPARVTQDRGRPGRPRRQHGPRLSCPGPAGLRRRPHAFHTGARRWNRGHSRDLAKSTNSERMGLEGRLR